MIFNLTFSLQVVLSAIFVTSVAIAVKIQTLSGY